MKVAAVSDLHGFYPEIPKCDVLLVAGDILGPSDIFMQMKMLNGPFLKWIERIPAKDIILVAGNHDLIFEQRKELLPLWPENVHYLQDKEITIDGKNIYGSPWQRRFCDWAFNLDEWQLEEVWNNIPTSTDILVTHSPPFGVGDFNKAGVNLGSPSLTKRVEEISPMLHVYGHIHEGRGVYNIGDTIAANVTLVDDAYKPVYKVMEFNL